MYTITINHRDGDTKTYKIFRKEEAEKEGIDFVYWKDAQKGDYAVSDDDYVAYVINRSEYESNHKIKNVYLRFPWGYTFYNPKYSSKQLKVAGRKSNTTFTGKRPIEVIAGKDYMRNLATVRAILQDDNLAIDWVFGSTTPSEHRKYKRYMKSEAFKKMVKEELAQYLQEHDLTEDYTLELLKEGIEIAREKKDVPGIMRAVENLQDMHGMKDKHLVKTTERLEAHSSTKLIDELREEESSLIAQKTITKDEG
tara:strand:- start:152 stop:910 length:759 start_codon:yes stop_codon:yes gene_type:complete